MATNTPFDETLSAWLEAEAPARIPGRVLEATFEQTRRSRQDSGWRGLFGRSGVMHFAPQLAGAAVVVVVAGALALGSIGGHPAPAGPIATPGAERAFLGAWISTSDADGGTQRMTVGAAPDGSVDIVVTDDIASVCSGTPSTMTGTGRAEGGTKLVIPEPDYRCDDGRDPTALSGPPLAEQLRDLTFVRDALAESLTDNHGGTWLREVETTPSSDPTTTPSPASEAALAALLNGFLEARVAGAGAQRYLSTPEQEVPLLYGTTSGARYERAEFEQVHDIEWPYGDVAFKVRLFAGNTVVEQLHFVGPDRPLQLEYNRYGFASDIAPTTEDGRPVPVSHEVFDGGVTLRAAHPWVLAEGSSSDRLFGGRLIPEGPGVQPTTDGGQRIGWDELLLIADPMVDGTGCAAAADPVDAKGLAARIRSHAGFGTTAPVAVRVAGIQGLMMDVAIPAGASLHVAASESGDPCPQDVLRPVASDYGYGGTATGERMRLYLLDVPGGLSLHTLAIEVVAPGTTFERAVAAAAPVVDSIELHAP